MPGIRKIQFFRHGKHTGTVWRKHGRPIHSGRIFRADKKKIFHNQMTVEVV